MTLGLGRSALLGRIDKALRASQLTIADLAGFGRGRVYHSEIGPGGKVVSTDTTLFAIVNQRPFGAIDPDSLARAGYVFGDEAKGWIFYAPDETVLLSDQFATTHCFRLVREAARPGAIGVAFEPVPQRKSRISLACSGWTSAPRSCARWSFTS